MKSWDLSHIFIKDSILLHIKRMLEGFFAKVRGTSPSQTGFGQLLRKNFNKFATAIAMAGHFSTLVGLCCSLTMVGFNHFFATLRGKIIKYFHDNYIYDG